MSASKITIFDHLIIDETNTGKGIFSAKGLELNYPVCSIRGQIVNFSETIKDKKTESFYLQIGEDKYIKSLFPFYLFNHSCNPNCGINENMELVTIRPVKKGEELCWDFSTSMMERSWKMKCNCKEKNCRSVIQDFDTLPQNVQLEYLNMDIVLPFISSVLKQNTY